MTLKIGMIQAMAGAAIYSSFTFVPILAREHLGTDEIFITLIVGFYAAAAFISSYIFGRAGDIYGRRIILRLGLILASLTFGLVAVATTPELLFIARTTSGFCAGMYPGALTAYAYESKVRMGRFASFGAIGWGIGSVFIGYAAGFNINYAFLFASVFYIIAFASAMTLPSLERIRMEIPWFPIETFKRNKSIYVAFFIRHSSVTAVWTLWSLFLVDLGGDYLMIGLIHGLNSIAQAVFMVSLTDRFDCRNLVSIGLLTSMLTFLSISFVTNIMEVFPTQVILGLSWACLYVGSLKYVTENNEDRSTASGLLSSVLSLSTVAGPIIAMILFTIWPSYLPLFLNAAFMSLLAFVLFRFSSRESISEDITLVGCGKPQERITSSN